MENIFVTAYFAISRVVTAVWIYLKYTLSHIS